MLLPQAASLCVQAEIVGPVSFACTHRSCSLPVTYRLSCLLDSKELRRKLICMRLSTTFAEKCEFTLNTTEQCGIVTSRDIQTYLDEFLNVRSVLGDIIVFDTRKEYLKPFDKWHICNVHQTELAKEERSITELSQGRFYFIQRSN